MRTLCTDRFYVDYHIEASSYEEAKAIAWSIQVEQTIEFPYELVTDKDILDQMVGRLENLELLHDSGVQQYRATISYGIETSAMEATQFLNVVFGNSSLQPHIWVHRIRVPQSLIDVFKGPRFGIEGIRQLVHTPKRAMIQAVIKPMGTPNETLATMCRDYTLGGADVIKDDHGLTNQPFSHFKDRVARCADAVREANVQVKGHTIYAANVSGDGTDVLERAYYAKEAGATGIMVAPALIGYGWLHKLRSADDLGLPIIVHPAMMGGFSMPGISGIHMSLWMGFLPRLMGADMNIFTSYGGRFTFSPEDCLQVIDESLKPVEGLKASCPSAGGGITEKRLPELLDLYGEDMMFLVGGDMFRRGPHLKENMEAFVKLLTDYHVHKD